MLRDVTSLHPRPSGARGQSAWPLGAGGDLLTAGEDEERRSEASQRLPIMETGMGGEPGSSRAFPGTQREKGALTHGAPQPFQPAGYERGNNQTLPQTGRSVSTCR